MLANLNLSTWVVTINLIVNRNDIHEMLGIPLIAVAEDWPQLLQSAKKKNFYSLDGENISTGIHRVGGRGSQKGGGEKRSEQQEFHPKDTNNALQGNQHLNWGWVKQTPPKKTW